jgi:NitT/TauT family transport system permease protein
MAFAIGTIAGLACGMWLALSPTASAIFDPYVKALNSMPRVILAPIFSVWFGLGVWSKVALGVTLVFFIVFFNVYQGVREVSPNVLSSVRMLGASRRDLLRHVYLPSAMSWVFSSLHTAVGLAFVGAVVGEYLGSARGVGYLILQAEGTFDINSVFAGILVLTVFALLLDALVGFVERRLMTWRYARRWQGEASATCRSSWRCCRRRRTRRRRCRPATCVWMTWRERRACRRCPPTTWCARAAAASPW